MNKYLVGANHMFNFVLSHEKVSDKKYRYYPESRSLPGENNQKRYD